jgi:hypothetical protein
MTGKPSDAHLLIMACTGCGVHFVVGGLNEENVQEGTWSLVDYSSKEYSEGYCCELCQFDHTGCT